MTLQELIKTLQQIALTQPNVRTATDGDIYEVMNGNPSVRYGVFHITQNTHQSYEDRDVYGLNLFYVDRNEDDDANTLQIQSIGKSVIDNIIRTFIEDFDGDFPTITYTPFTQRFKDDTAGVFAGISMEVYKDWICPDTYGEFITDMNVVRNQDKTIKVTQSGIYVVTPDEGYTGLGEVVVDAELANTVQDVKSIEITENGEYSVVADAPFLSIGKVDIDVNLPLQEDKSVMIADNGTYTVTKDDGYVGMVDINIVVDLPIQDKKELTVNNNGTYTISADDEYVGMKTAEVTFEYQPKKQLPNGMRLSNSTFTEFDMTEYDWSMVYDCSQMFENCDDLTTLLTVPNFHPLGVSQMFSNCSNLTEIKGIENWDTSNVTSMYRMFSSCSNLTSLEPLENWNTSNVTDMYSMFGGCRKLTSLEPLENWNTSNVTNMKDMFISCHGLTSLEPLENWDTSNVTDMSDMFYNCQNLESIKGIENWNTSNVTSISQMFYGCKGLTSVDLSGWDLSNLENIGYLFRNCNKLTSVKMGGNVNKLNSAQSMFASVTTTGTFYYPAQYDYSKIIAQLPSTWTAVAY